MRDVGGVRDVGVVRGAVAALMRHIVVNGKEAAHAFPIQKEKTTARCSFTLCASSNLGTVIPLFFLWRNIQSSFLCLLPLRPHCS